MERNNLFTSLQLKIFLKEIKIKDAVFLYFAKYVF